MDNEYEALIQSLLEQGILDDEQGLLMQQMARADALRNTPTPEGMRTGGGQLGTYVAANPLEHIAAAASRIKGHMDTKEIPGQMRGLSKKRAAGNADFLRSFFGRRASTPAPFAYAQDDDYGSSGFRG